MDASVLIKTVSLGVPDTATEPTASTDVRAVELLEWTNDSVNILFAEKFASSCDDYADRLKQGKKKKLSPLGGNIWYGTEYMDCLKTAECIKRFIFLRKKNAVLYGYCPKTFEKVNDGESGGPYTYRVKSDVDPSTAMRSLRTDLCFVDCTMAFQIVALETLLEVLGDEAFNRLFSLHGSYPLVISKEMQLCCLFRLMKFRKLFYDIPGSRSYQVGEVAGASNHKDYYDRNPFGLYGAINIARIPSDGEEMKFHGFGLPKGGVTEKGLNEALVEGFNSPPNRHYDYYSGAELAMVKGICRENLVLSYPLRLESTAIDEKNN